MSLALHPTQVSTLPHKVIQMGMRVALSARVKDYDLRIVETLTGTAEKLRTWPSVGHKTLFITGEDFILTEMTC
jgi:ribosomal protein L4